jgi:chemotaxis protein histidine kinase CheA
MTEHEDLVREFLIESYENLDRLDRDLVELEKNPHDKERLGSVFRTIHTIKGTVGFLGAPDPTANRHRYATRPRVRNCSRRATESIGFVR